MGLIKNGKEIKTFQKLKENLTCNGDSYSKGRYTMEGEFELNGEKVFVYRHWSYNGNFHIYADCTLTACIGQIVKTGDIFPYLDSEGNQVLEHGWLETYDWNISIADV